MSKELVLVLVSFRNYGDQLYVAQSADIVLVQECGIVFSLSCLRSEWWPKRRQFLVHGLVVL